MSPLKAGTEQVSVSGKLYVVHCSKWFTVCSFMLYSLRETAKEQTKTEQKEKSGQHCKTEFNEPWSPLLPTAARGTAQARICGIMTRRWTNRRKKTPFLL